MPRARVLHTIYPAIHLSHVRRKSIPGLSCALCLFSVILFVFLVFNLNKFMCRWTATSRRNGVQSESKPNFSSGYDKRRVERQFQSKWIEQEPESFHNISLRPAITPASEREALDAGSKNCLQSTSLVFVGKGRVLRSQRFRAASCRSSIRRE